MMPFKVIVNDAVRFFLNNLRQIVTLCGPFLLAGAIFKNLVLARVEPGMSSENMLFTVLLVNFVYMALYPLYTGGLILMMARQAENQLPTNSELIASVLRIYFPFLVMGFIAGSLIMLGLFVFILPGVWLMIRFAFCEFFLVTAKMDPRTALISSFKATGPYFLQILALLALFALPFHLLGPIVDNTLTSADAGLTAKVVVDTAVSIPALFVDVVLFRLFMEIRPLSPGEVDLTA